MALTPVRTPDRILVRSANWVGDAIMSTPTVRAIRKRFPGARITLLAKPWVMPVFKHNPYIDVLMTYDANGRHRGPAGVYRLSRDVAGERFDLAILFQNAFEAALIAWMARIPQRLGFTTDARSLLLTHRVRSWPALKKGHLVDYYLGLIAAAGGSSQDRRLDLFLSPEERAAARNACRDLGIGAGRRIVGINPGATYGTAKRWPRERFVELSRRLIGRYGASVLIFGGPGEARLGARIAEEVGSRCFNLCNRTSLREAMALIDRCDAFVTNDSGLMHVAAALNVPQIAIIGPTDPVATGPVNRASRLVRADGSCRRAPCLLPHCPIDHRCMTSIPVDRVATAVAELLNGGIQA
jgi:heptosyltransferase-2